MTTKAILLLLFVALASMGSSCINENFLVAVNYPFSTCVSIRSGPNLAFDGSETVTLSNYIDQSYLNKMKGARYYDIRVTTKGTYNGTVLGDVYIEGEKLVTYNGQWSAFAAPQSILTSKLLTKNDRGVATLVAKLNEFVTNINARATISNGGTLTGESQVPEGLSVCVEILAQVDSEVN
jgi:hypothetical protein